MIRYLGRNGAARAARTLSARASMRGPYTRHVADVGTNTSLSAVGPERGPGADPHGRLHAGRRLLRDVHHDRVQHQRRVDRGLLGGVGLRRLPRRRQLRQAQPHAPKAAPGVTVRAQNPGRATIAGATVGGSYITLAQFKVQGGSVDVQPGSTGMTVDHNLHGRRRAATTASTSVPGSTTARCNDVTITGNSFQGTFDEDQIQANLYHDGPDGDPYGLLIEGNEFVGQRRVGQPQRRLAVGLGRRPPRTSARTTCTTSAARASSSRTSRARSTASSSRTTSIVRQNLPCDPTSLCPTWQLSPFQVFGPVKNVSIRHNTVWPGSGGGKSMAARLGLGRPDGVLRQRLRQPQLRRQRPDDRLHRVEQHLLRRQRLPTPG